MDVVPVPCRDIGFGDDSYEPKYEELIDVSVRERTRGVPKLDPQIYMMLAKDLLTP
jgi:hypothetical protein